MDNIKQTKRVSVLKYNVDISELDDFWSSDYYNICYNNLRL